MGLQCDDTWVRRKGLDASLNNRCPGQHIKIRPNLSDAVKAERWNTFRDAFGDPPAIPRQAEAKANIEQRISSTDPSIPAQVAGVNASP